MPRHHYRWAIDFGLFRAFALSLYSVIKEVGRYLRKKAVAVLTQVQGHPPYVFLNQASPVSVDDFSWVSGILGSAQMEPVLLIGTAFPFQHCPWFGRDLWRHLVRLSKPGSRFTRVVVANHVSHLVEPHHDRLKYGSLHSPSSKASISYPHRSSLPPCHFVKHGIVSQSCFYHILLIQAP